MDLLHLLIEHLKTLPYLNYAAYNIKKCVSMRIVYIVTANAHAFINITANEYDLIAKT